MSLILRDGWSGCQLTWDKSSLTLVPMDTPLARAPSYMTRFRRWWEETDLLLAARGHKFLNYDAARALFETDLEPEQAAQFMCRDMLAIEGSDED
jgi:hypothetical protein